MLEIKRASLSELTAQCQERLASVESDAYLFAVSAVLRFGEGQTTGYGYRQWHFVVWNHVLSLHDDVGVNLQVCSIDTHRKKGCERGQRSFSRYVALLRTVPLCSSIRTSFFKQRGVPTWRGGKP